jgi:hypothetical protein
MADHSPNPTTTVEELLSAYLDGSATAEERRRAEALLDADRAAARTLAELRYTVSLLAETPPVPLPRAFTLSERHVQPAAATRFPWLAWLSPIYLRGAAALVAICLLVLVVGDPSLSTQLAPVTTAPTSGVGEAQQDEERGYSPKGPDDKGSDSGTQAQQPAEEATQEVTTTLFLGLSTEALRGLQVALALLLGTLLVASFQLNRLT